MGDILDEMFEKSLRNIVKGSVNTLRADLLLFVYSCTIFIIKYVLVMCLSN